MKRIPALVVAAASVAWLLTGCAGASNAGGATQCRDFLAMNTADQGAVVARMLKERNGRNSSTSDVADRRQAIVRACGPADKQGARIESVTG